MAGGRGTAVALLSAVLSVAPATPASSQPASRDVTGPRLVAFDVTPQTVDVTAGSVTVVFSARVTDDTGVRDRSLRYCFEGWSTPRGFCATLTRTGGSAVDAQFHGSLTVPASTPVGFYDAYSSGLSVTDVLGNTTRSFPGIPRHLVVTAGQPASVPVPRIVPPVPVPAGTRLRLTVEGPPGATVRLERAPPRSPSDFSPAGSSHPLEVLDAQGRKTYTVAAAEGMRYQVREAARGQVSAPVTITTTAPPVTISAAPRAIRPGETSTVRVTGEPGQAVELYAYSRPSTTYRRVRHGVFDELGLAYWYITPGGNTRLYARSGGRTTATTTVNVALQVSLGVRQDRGRYRFSGTVRPGVDGLPVTLLRALPGGGAAVVGRTTTTGGGRWTIDRRLTDAGTSGFYAVTGTSPDNVSGRSRTYVVSVATATLGMSFGPSQTLVRGGALWAAVQATAGDDGRVRGFTATGSPQSRVDWFEGRGSRWRVEQTPYRGDVLATAHDRTGTYLLLRTARNGLRVVKRATSGQYTAGRELQPPAQRPPPMTWHGDLVARDGRWWAVWGLRYEGLERDTELWEAGTFGGTYVRRQVTGSAARDWAPTLALGAGPSPRAHLVWLRGGDLWSAVADRPGAWRQSRQLGGPARGPDLVVADGVLHLVWHRDGAVWYGRGSAARMTSERVSTRTVGFDSARLAVSRGHAFIVFEGSGQVGPPTMLAGRQTPSSPWRTSVLWRLLDVSQFGITAVDGRATVLIGDWRSGAVLVRSQEA